VLKFKRKFRRQRVKCAITVNISVPYTDPLKIMSSLWCNTCTKMYCRTGNLLLNIRWLSSVIMCSFISPTLKLEKPDSRSHTIQNPDNPILKFHHWNCFHFSIFHFSLCKLCPKVITNSLYVSSPFTAMLFYSVSCAAKSLIFSMD